MNSADKNREKNETKKREHVVVVRKKNRINYYVNL